MADSEINGSVEQCEEAGAGETVLVAESGSPTDSVVKSLEEEFSEVARSVEDKVAQSSFVQEVEKLAHSSDPWGGIKNLGVHKDEQYQVAPEESMSPASEKKSEETRDLHENPKATHTQPFVAVSAGSRASWANCCGLLDLLKPSDH